jgi:hypothetical protein
VKVFGILFNLVIIKTTTTIHYSILTLNLTKMARKRELLDDVQRALIAFFKKNTSEESITLREIASAI